MAEFSMPFDAKMLPNGDFDREYNAAQWIKYFQPLVTTGVVQPGLKVTGTGGMSTTMAIGQAYVLNRYYENDANKIFTHEVETAGMKRIDFIVIGLDMSLATRSVTSYIKKGIAAAEPDFPPLVRSGDVYEIAIASVPITGGQTTISKVDDLRPQQNVCGWADSKILPSYNESVLQTHIKNDVLHTNYVVATVSGGSLSVSVPSITTYTNGMALVVQVNTKPTGNLAININSLAAKTILKLDGDRLTGDDIVAGSIFTLRYNGTSFILQGEGGGKLKYFKTNQAVSPVGATLTLNTSFNAGFKIKSWVIRVGGVQVDLSAYSMLIPFVMYSEGLNMVVKTSGPVQENGSGFYLLNATTSDITVNPASNNILNVNFSLKSNWATLVSSQSVGVDIICYG